MKAKKDDKILKFKFIEIFEFKIEFSWQLNSILCPNVNFF